MNPCYEQLKTLTLNIKVHHLYSKNEKKGTDLVYVLFWLNCKGLKVSSK